jgi:hypothetical protein
MAVTHRISVEEYLPSTIEHDAESVEGRIVHCSGPHNRTAKCKVISIRRSTG